MAIKCPKCSAAITGEPDEQGILTCGKCGARLRSKAQAAPRAQGGPNASNPSLPKIDPKRAAPADVDSVLARIDSPPSPDATVRPGALPPVGRPNQVPPGPVSAALQEIAAELRAIRGAQQQILALLGERPAPQAPQGELSYGRDDEQTTVKTRPVTRSSRTSVLVVDDDAGARQEAANALQLVGAVEQAADGNAALAAIARQRPAAIVLELGLGGKMPGRDLVNMIKATMEWVDIPLVLYTRMELDGVEDARQQGADDIVRKGPGGANALAAKVSRLIAR